MNITSKNHKLKRIFANILSIVAILAIAFPATGSVHAQDEVPTLYAEIGFDWVDGRYWPLENEVTLTIEDPNTPKSPDYTAKEIVGTDQLPTYVRFDVWEDEFDLKPGQVITLTDGTTTRTHTALDIGITNVDMADNYVDGFAPTPGSLNVLAHDPCWENVTTLTDEKGYWIAFFTCNLSTVAFISAEMQGTDDIGVSTGFFWSPPPPPPEPSFSARITENQVHGYGWPLGVQVSLTVNDIGFGPETVVQADWDPNETFVWFDLGESLTLQGGQYIEMTYGDIVKTHTVTNLVVTGVDPVEDTVFGTADAGTQVEVGHIYCDEYGCFGFRREEADAIGDWTADFSVVGEDDDEQDIIDIQPGMGSEARQCDDDGDCTQYGWYVSNPHFTVYPVWNAVELWEWPDGVLVSAIVEGKPECAAEGWSGYPEWDPWTTNVWMNFPEGCDVTVDDVVTVTDGVMPQTHTVRNLSVTEVNAEDDTVAGTADPGATVHVWPHGFGEYEVQSTADGGVWLADFSGFGEDTLQPGMDGRSEVRDDHGNATAVDWHIPYPTIAVRANDDWIDGWEWPLDAIVTIEIDDPSTPENPDHTEYNITASVPDWDPNTTYFEVNLHGLFDIQVDFDVTATDGTTIKTHKVTNLSFTQIDTETEMVYGMATPDGWIGVWSCDDEHCVNRDVGVDGFGNWEADFSVPGDQEWEVETFDIQPGTWVDSQEEDADGDRTMFGMNVPPPVEGYHDYDQGDVPGFACNAGGWAMDPDDPEATVNIRISVDGTQVLEIPADGYREDLETSWNEGGGGCPGGNCAFEESLWDYLTHYEAHEILVEAQDLLSGEWYPLGESPKTLTCRTYDIYAYNPLTGTTTQITDLRDADEYNPSWSPNGKLVAHDVVGGDFHSIYITNVKTGVSAPLAGADDFGDDAVWSPNGKWIAFDRVPAEDYSLYLVPAAGGVRTLIREDAVSADWAPNGKRLVFQQLSDGSIWTVPVDGGKGGETLIALRGAYPVWSPDGNWIAYEMDGDIWKVRVNVQGRVFGDPIQVTSGPFNDSQPTWSFDSMTIAYHSGFNEDWDIWTVPAEGGMGTWLTGAVVFGDYDPAYAKNSSNVAYGSFSPNGQAGRTWVAAYTYDAGTWDTGTHTYQFWAEGNPTGEERSFDVASNNPLYSGKVLIRGGTLRAETSEGCADIDVIHPEQQTQFHVGWTFDGIFADAQEFYTNFLAQVRWDTSEPATMQRHEVFPLTPPVDWFGYTCTFTVP